MRAVISARRVAPDPHVLQVHIRPLLRHRMDDVGVVRATCEKRVSCLSFRYVCREPVLVKRPFLA
jgi:hypothetical protein